jgi:hypothetical protein
MHAQPAWQQQQGGCRLPDALQQFITTTKHSAGSLHSQQQQGPGSAAGLVPSILSDNIECELAAGDNKHYGGLLLVDFGSMGCLGLLRDAQLLLAVLLQALQLLNW